MTTPVYSTATNQVAALKELYTGDDYMKDLVYKKNPFMALIPKDESPDGFAGKYIPVPLVYATPQGRSHTFANAQSNQTAPGVVSFFVYRISDYQLVTITNELLEATKNNASAFVDEAKLNMDTAFRNISNNVAQQLFASGTGSRGQISTITSGVIVLTDPNSVVQFEVGMVLVASATDGATPRAALGYVIAVNRTTGVVTVSATQGGSAGSPASWAANDYLAVQGDVGASGSTTTASFLSISGLQAWLPFTAPTGGDNFWGVDRSVDPTRLAGVRYDGSAETIEEALIDGSSLLAREGGDPDMAWMNFASWAALEKSLGSKVQYVDVRHDEADIAFAGIRVHTPYGPVTVLPDRSCPTQTCFLLTMSSFKLRSLGRVPHILTYGLEGLEGLRVGSADALEIRIGYYGNLVCNAPGWNANIKLSQ